MILYNTSQDWPTCIRPNETFTIHVLYTYICHVSARIIQTPNQGNTEQEQGKLWPGIWETKVDAWLRHSTGELSSIYPGPGQTKRVLDALIL